MKIASPSMRLRQVAAGAAALAFALCSGCRPAAVPPARSATAPPLTVPVTQPKRSGITRTISLTATIAANQQATLYSKVAGYLKTIAVDKGDEVKAGQLLAEIEVPELLADLARFEAEAEIARLDYKRAGDAYKQAPDLVIVQSVDSAKAKSLMAEANLERARTLLSFCRITAPFAGVVTRRAVDPGAFIPSATSGSAAQNAAVVTLMDFEKVRVQVAVPEPEVPLIRKDLPAKVRVDELPGRGYEGRVSRFSHVLDEASKTMLVEIDLDNPKRELRPGMFAIVQIGVETHADALTLPAEALVLEKTASFVFCLEDGKAKKKPVKVGFHDGTKFEVTEGVQEDQRVLVPGRIALVDGAVVNATEVP